MRKELRAYAKINLGLDVLGRLPNGYHEVRMVMQTVGIYDELIFEKADSEIVITTDLAELPVDENNLIYKAVKLLFEKYNIVGGVRVHLKKNIPIAAGMAGGSADAAATLRGVNELFGLGCDIEELKELGVKIGADVPYCVMGGTALAEGIGERLTVLTDAPNCVLLVAKPDINVSTKYVYEHLDAKEEYEHPDIDKIMDAIRTKDIEAMAANLGNVLESVTIAAYPVIDDLKKIMKDEGALGSMMSGSGPSVFGIYTDENKAKRAYDIIRERGLAKQIFITGFVTI